MNRQGEEWNFQSSIDWHLLQYGVHSVQQLIRDLNALYKFNRPYMKSNFQMKGLNDRLQRC